MSTLRLAALLCLPLFVVSGRLYLEARADLAEAARLAERADSEAVEARIVALGRAARRYLPFGPSSTARLELATLGRAEVPGAFETLRASILAVRWLRTPDEELLEEAERALAHRRATQALLAGALRVPDPAEVDAMAQREASLLSRRLEPSRALVLLALGGCALFLGGVQRALAGVRPRRASLVAVLGFALFVVGLWRA